MRAAGSAVYIVRCYNRVNQLHESGRSVECRPTRVCVNGLFAVTLPFSSVLLVLRMSARVLWGIRAGTSFHKCKGKREYVRKPSFVCVVDRACKFFPVLTLVLEGFDAVVLRALTTASEAHEFSL